MLRAHQGPAARWRSSPPIDGGLLLQATDRLQAAGDDPATWTLADRDARAEATLDELAFAWRACRA